MWYLSIFRKSVEKIQVGLNSNKNNGYFTWRPPYIYDNTSLTFFLEWEMFQTKVVEKIKIEFNFQWLFFSKILALWDNVEKYCRAGLVTDDKMAHALCMLDSEGYTHRLKICKTYCSSMLKQWSRERSKLVRQTYIACLASSCQWHTLKIVDPHTPYTSVCQPLWDRGPVNSFFIRRGPGPNKFTRKYLSNFLSSYVKLT